MRDLSSSEVGKSLQRYRVEILKLLIMRELRFSGTAKRREKYRIEIRASGVGELGGTSGLLQTRGEFGSRLATEGGLSKIFTNYASMLRTKLRTVVCVHGAMLFRNAT